MRVVVALSLGLALLTAGCPGPDPTDGGNVDGPPFDGGSCTTDTDCDDERFCTGVERCVGGGCVPGEAMRCDDGIACTTDRCSEARRACESLPSDADGDGRGVMGCLDGDDCDDSDPARYPGALELCDDPGLDEDCNPDTLGGLDEDGDGFESAACCNGARCGTDCDDARSTVRPDGLEICNGLDDDCSGMVDEGTLTTVYEDRDRDGFGTGATVMRCAEAAGFAVEPGDCDDVPGALGLSRNPAQAELCDMVDNDCDMRTDESAAPVPWYVDADGDGFGAAGSTPISSCMPIAGRSLRATDCDDTMAGVGPGSAERCNGTDDDCNGLADFSVGPGDFEDDDGDGEADLMCGAPIGTDCNDRSASVGSGDAELCDGRDNDCDDIIDEASSRAVFFLDRDGDGYGSEASGTVVACASMGGYVVRGGDCDDDAAQRFPGATERCDARDDDCDGTSDETPASVACTLPNATAACAAGACRVVRCDPGFAACEGASRSGCEIDLTTNVSHCGACDRSCSSTGASGPVTCEAGRCVVPSCEAGLGDCNMDGIDGCETPLNFAMAHCGACARACPAGRNQRATCALGTCSVECLPSYFDCNGSAADGCESLAACTTCGPGAIDCAGIGNCNILASDERHCGACGRACGPGGTCIAGECDGVAEIVTGTAHTCIRREGGGVACWGTGVAGSVSGAPSRVALPAPAVDLASGYNTACAALASGAVFCWGRDDVGQLGNDASFTDSRTPVPVAIVPGLYQLSAGGEHFVAFGSGVFGWGLNDSGRIETSATLYFPTPTPMALDAQGVLATVVAGDRFTCGLYQAVFSGLDVIGGGCVGTLPGSMGGLVGPMGELFVRDLPTPSFSGAATHGGAGFLCASVLDTVMCGGAPTARPATGLEPSTVVDRLIASRVVGTIGGGIDTTCGLDVLSRVRCHGRNDFLQLGAPITISSSYLGELPAGLPRASLISEGQGHHNCALDLSGRVWCWGRNDARQCGVPGDVPVPPTLVTGL